VSIPSIVSLSALAQIDARQAKHQRLPFGYLPKGSRKFSHGSLGVEVLVSEFWVCSVRGVPRFYWNRNRLVIKFETARQPS